MMNKRRSFLVILLLSLPFIMGLTASNGSGSIEENYLTLASATSDSANVNSTINKPGSTTPYYPGVTKGSPGVTVNDVYDATGEKYLPCPGDPSNPSFPRTPICPDINGKYPPGTSFNPTAVWTSPASTYFFAATGQPFMSGANIISYAQVYCPDVCLMTRFNTPAPTPGSANYKQVTYFQTPSCPAGYDMVSEYNNQPAIVYLTATFEDYPIDSLSKYNGYIAQGDDCSSYDVYAGANTTCQVAGTASQWQNNYYVPSGSPTFDTVTTINGYVAYYHNDTDYNSCYYNPPNDCSSKVPSAIGCPWPSSAYLRSYKFSYYNKKCKRTAGYYYSPTSFTPATIVCVRSKATYLAPQ